MDSPVTPCICATEKRIVEKLKPYAEQWSEDTTLDISLISSTVFGQVIEWLSVNWYKTTDLCPTYPY